jgi:hypothetical protein
LSEQIAVAGDDKIRMTVDRQFEKFVVRGIAARDDPLGDRHQLGRGHQLPQPGLRLRINR